MAYQSLVHSQLGYASAVWDLYTKYRTHKSEMVQKRAAWWTLSDYNRTYSVTSLQSQLNWQTLEGRRSVVGLFLFYKFAIGLMAVLLPTICSPHLGSQGIAILWHSIKFIQARTTINTPFFHWQLSSRMPSKLMFSCPKSLDRQGNFDLSSLPRLTSIHHFLFFFITLMIGACQKVARA